MAWQPNQQGLSQLVELLRNTQVPDQNVQRHIHEQLEAFSNSVADFNNYLVFILSRLRNEPDFVRAAAGLKLKNNILAQYDRLPMEVIEYIRSEVLSCLADPMVTVRQAVGSIITTVVVKGSLIKWPVLLPTLVQNLDSTDSLLVDGSLHALALIFEDYAQDLDSQDVSKPMNALVPKLLGLFKSPHESFRQSAVLCFYHLTLDPPGALLVHMDTYIQGLIFLASDKNNEVRARVFGSLVLMLEVRADYLVQYLPQHLLPLMLHATQHDRHEKVVLESCEFWCALSETKLCRQYLPPFLPALVSVLLDRMVYSDEDAESERGEMDDASVPDQDKDIKPFFSAAKSRGSAQRAPAQDPSASQAQAATDSVEGEDEYEYEDDDDDSSETPQWTVRKHSAAALDMLATALKQDILPCLLPAVQQRMNDKNWKNREVAVLALGAIAEGCYAGMHSHLPMLVPYLFTVMADPDPLLRSIACWTLSRYCTWIVEQADESQFFRPFLFALLQYMMDPSKKVQEASCSALSTLEEIGQALMGPYIAPVLQTLMAAFHRYQARNLFILYDAIQQLATAVGSELSRPEHVQVLLPPLTQKWNQLADDDRRLLPLLECMTTLVPRLGLAFQPYAQAVYQRCCHIIETTLVTAKDETDKEFIICSLYLISGLVEGLGTGIESLIGASNLPALLYECCKSKGRADLRQAAFALLGDLAKTCVAHLKPHLQHFMSVAVENLDPHIVPVCNNASWSIGEITAKIPTEMGPYVLPIMQRLLPIITKGSYPVNLLENAAVTIGRLGAACPEVLGPLLEQLVVGWCRTLAGMHDSAEKEGACRGLCATIKANPAGVVKNFQWVCAAINSWQHPPDDLRNMFGAILHGFKNSDAQSWANYFNNFPPALRASLQAKYQL